MSDLQLSILLEKYADLLQIEIDRIHEEIPIEQYPQFWVNAQMPSGEPSKVCWLTANLWSLKDYFNDDVELLRSKEA